MKYYIRAIKKTFFTSGRDSRKEFWSFFVVHSLIGFFLVILDFIIAIIFHRETLFFLVGIYVLLTVITVFTSAIRRFHDINISWIWFVLLNLIPFIGFIINIILLLQKGDDTKNKYGDPKTKSFNISNSTKIKNILWVCLSIILYTIITFLFTYHVRNFRSTIFNGNEIQNINNYQKGFSYFNKKKYNLALKYFKYAAKEGNVKSMGFIGLMYYQGLGVDKNYNQAFDWFYKSAINEDPISQYFIGVMYDKGLGVKINIERAIYWIKKSAKNNYCMGQAYLGKLYFFGRGIEKNRQKAKIWIQKAMKNSNIPKSSKKIIKQFWDKYELWKY